MVWVAAPFGSGRNGTDPLRAHVGKRVALAHLCPTSLQWSRYSKWTKISKVDVSRKMLWYPSITYIHYDGYTEDTGTCMYIYIFVPPQRCPYFLHIYTKTTMCTINWSNSHTNGHKDHDCCFSLDARNPIATIPNRNQ
jgi:hypothetical protein